MSTDAQMKAAAAKEFKQLTQEFHEYWKANGEPHPASNAYIALNRVFFYSKGMERGVQLMVDDKAFKEFGLGK